jgi:hypothetical protein
VADGAPPGPAASGPWWLRPRSVIPRFHRSQGRCQPGGSVEQFTSHHGIDGAFVDALTALRKCQI